MACLNTQHALCDDIESNNRERGHGIEMMKMKGKVMEMAMTMVMAKKIIK